MKINLSHFALLEYEPSHANESHWDFCISRDILSYIFLSNSRKDCYIEYEISFIVRLRNSFIKLFENVIDIISRLSKHFELPDGFIMPFCHSEN